MELKEMLQQLIDLGTAMRNYQMQYFRETDRARKKDLLCKAKSAEAQFDKAVFTFKQHLK